jgi:hemerythrin-like domain-containing protein
MREALTGYARSKNTIMNNPVEILQEEHRQLLYAVKVARQIQKVDDDEIYRELVRDMIIFLRNYTEAYHHPKEEYFLYPLLQNRASSMSAEFVHEVCDNHQEFKALMASIENHYVMYDYRQLRKTMSDYLEVLSEHIRRENKVVLTVAGNLLTADELKKMSAEFEALDRKDGGKNSLVKGLDKLCKRIPVNLQL